ncbi:hypothetical protein LZC95_41670 [Pendulispora brunnea]|uniref:SH3 domain-containing protein n=1 Tax=Pendulispora brunnea TaxID=2905690 RepID=A0ABZ2K6P3_9BACT
MTRATLATLAIAALATTVWANPAHAETRHTVTAQDVYVRSAAGSYAMGRLYNGQTFDVQYTDSNGWSYGYAYGYVNRCVWVQRSALSSSQGDGVHNCRTSPKNLYDYEFTNGEIWGSASDGMEYILPRDTYMWDNWSWGNAWGNHNYRGIAPAGSCFKIRYTTNDGGGVMARPCGVSDWFFIQRGAL